MATAKEHLATVSDQTYKKFSREEKSVLVYSNCVAFSAIFVTLAQIKKLNLLSATCGCVVRKGKLTYMPLPFLPLSLTCTSTNSHTAIQPISWQKVSNWSVNILHPWDDLMGQSEKDLWQWLQLVWLPDKGALHLVLYLQFIWWLRRSSLERHSMISITCA